MLYCGRCGGGDPFGCSQISCLPSHSGINLLFPLCLFLQKVEIFMICVLCSVLDFRATLKNWVLGFFCSVLASSATLNNWVLIGQPHSVK